ncbi:hypothetical protein GGH94_000043 [Coemansia aciculifera]|uniref:RING-type domain-containing protein n=1 Tax=Coemansia aciculifera TaxID=417176 RepID=A0A9W8M669_9FUNG|nr:hypothetical protein GGH94_000043 [Coemansia aciculifera]
MTFCLSDGLMQVDYDDEEEFVYSEEEEDIQSPGIPSSDKLSQAQKQADSVAYYNGDEDEFDDFDADDDDEQPTSAIQQSNKPWEVDFKAHDLSGLQGKQEEVVNDLEPLLAVSRGSTALLLRSYEWKTESLVEDYLTDSNKVLTKSGVHAHPPAPSIETGDEDFTCEICYCSGGDELYMSLVCGHRFCTSCYETYVTIKIQEGGYNEESEGANKSVSDARVQLERYMHYFTRYNNHEQSAKFVLNLMEATEKNMEQLQREMTLAWIDVVFLKNAVDVLADCRAALKWTYVLAYYMVSDNHKVIFENNQSDLEMATEQLNELVEDPSSLTGIGDIKRKVLDMTHYVKARLDTLLTDTYQGLQESRWQYED